MPETAAQRADRRRRGAEVAVLRFDGMDDVRLMRLRRDRKVSGSSPEACAAGHRAALEAYARNHGLTMAELDRIRAVEALRRGSTLTRMSTERVSVR